MIERTITLNPGTTKNDDGRVVVMTSDVYVLLQACCAGKQATDFVFTRLDSKKKIKEFRDDWVVLCRDAGLGRLLCPHCWKEKIEVILNEDSRCPECSRKTKHPK